MPDLTSVANVKEAGRITGNSDDTLLGKLIDRAESVMALYCGRDAWAQAAYAAEEHDGHGTQTFQLRNTPIATSPAPVVTVRTGASTTRTQAASTYRVETETGIVSIVEGARDGFHWGDGYPSREKSGVWPKGKANLVVAYTGGLVTIPDALEHLAIEQTLFLLERTNRSRGLTAETIGAHSQSYATPTQGSGLLDEVASGLKALGYFRGGLA